MKFMQTRTKRAGKEDGEKRKEKRLLGGGGGGESERERAVYGVGRWESGLISIQNSKKWEMGRQNQTFWGSQQLCAKRDKANTAVA